VVGLVSRVQDSSRQLMTDEMHHSRLIVITSWLCSDFAAVILSLNLPLFILVTSVTSVVTDWKWIKHICDVVFSFFIVLVLS